MAFRSKHTPPLFGLLVELMFGSMKLEKHVVQRRIDLMAAEGIVSTFRSLPSHQANNRA
jgi:hypothetical protein